MKDSSINDLLKSIIEDDWMETQLDLYLTRKRDSSDRDLTNLHVSGLSGTCSRDIYYDFICPEKKLPFEPRQIMFFELGHATHEMMQKMYTEAGVLISTEVFMPDWMKEKHHLVGRCDGMLARDEGVWELKSANSNKFQNVKKYGIPEQVINQHCLYMMGADVEKGVIEYIDRGLGARLRVKNYYDEKRAKILLDKADKLWDCIENKRLPEVDVTNTNQCSLTCMSRKFCGKK